MSTYSNRLQPASSKTYYNVLFGSFTRDCHARCIAAHKRCILLNALQRCTDLFVNKFCKV